MLSLTSVYQAGNKENENNLAFSHFGIGISNVREKTVCCFIGSVHMSHSNSLKSFTIISEFITLLI